MFFLGRNIWFGRLCTLKPKKNFKKIKNRKNFLLKNPAFPALERSVTYEIVLGLAYRTE